MSTKALQDWQREVCDLFGYGPEDADEVLAYIPAWKAEHDAREQHLLEWQRQRDRWRKRAQVAEAKLASGAEDMGTDAVTQVKALRDTVRDLRRSLSSERIERLQEQVALDPAGEDV